MNQPSPTYEETIQQCAEICSASDFAEPIELGRSLQGREIPAMRITAPGPDEDRQVVLLAASTHGDEESGRAIALEAAAFLASGADRQSLDKQVFFCLPCCNPDGAASNQHRTGDQIDMARDFIGHTEPRSHEGRLIWDFIRQNPPDCVVDMHGLAGGSMKEHIWLAGAFDFSVDEHILHIIAREMALAGEQAGYPQGQPRSGRFRDLTGCSGLATKCYLEFKSLGLGLEAIEGYYRQQDHRSSGLARLKALFAIGNRTNFYAYYPGYPTHLISGSTVCALVPVGQTARARRINRAELACFLQRNFVLIERSSPDRDGRAIVTVDVQEQNGPVPQRYGLLVRIKKPAEIHGVSAFGQELPTGPTDGFIVYEDSCSKLVRIAVNRPLERGRGQVEIRYSCPYFGSRRAAST
ncbi:MAG: M14 family zinc carboxypeptidase [Phycisphaerae bacterium]